ncbi:hypothetical protein DAI22_10g130200 [Oryza sativa Japonica Group]|nr:hypothetical protein DAI22_10g130200 [Oryza sativa Japonica Group]
MHDSSQQSMPCLDPLVSTGNVASRSISTVSVRRLVIESDSCNHASSKRTVTCIRIYNRTRASASLFFPGHLGFLSIVPIRWSCCANPQARQLFNTRKRDTTDSSKF